MRIKKVTLKNEAIGIKFEKENDNGQVDEYDILCHDAPVATFMEAMETLVQDVLIICELPDGYGSTLAVTGVSFSYSEADVMSAVLTAVKIVSTANGPFCINTPNLPSEDAQGNGCPTLDALTVDHLKDLQCEAEKYVTGKRMQLELALDNAGEAIKKHETAEAMAMDEMVDEAMAIISETHRASTSSLQRRLRIGYTRAARIMDILEEKGIIGPPHGSDPREIFENKLPQKKVDA